MHLRLEPEVRSALAPQSHGSSLPSAFIRLMYYGASSFVLTFRPNNALERKGENYGQEADDRRRAAASPTLRLTPRTGTAQGAQLVAHRVLARQSRRFR